MARVAHLIGNGDSCVYYKPAKGLKVVCNLPPFAVDNVYVSCMVDFKMMKAKKGRMTYANVGMEAKSTKGYGAARTSGMGLQDEQLPPGKSLDYYKDLM